MENVSQRLDKVDPIKAKANDADLVTATWPDGFHSALSRTVEEMRTAETLHVKAEHGKNSRWAGKQKSTSHEIKVFFKKCRCPFIGLKLDGAQVCSIRLKWISLETEELRDAAATKIMKQVGEELAADKLTEDVLYARRDALLKEAGVCLEGSEANAAATTKKPASAKKPAQKKSEDVDNDSKQVEKPGGRKESENVDNDSKQFAKQRGKQSDDKVPKKKEATRKDVKNASKKQSEEKSDSGESGDDSEQEVPKQRRTNKVASERKPGKQKRGDCKNGPKKETEEKSDDGEMDDDSEQKPAKQRRAKEVASNRQPATKKREDGEKAANVPKKSVTFRQPVESDDSDDSECDSMDDIGGFAI